VEAEERIVVGVNKFCVSAETPPELLRVNPQLRELQMRKLSEVRKNRDNTKVKKILSDLGSQAARNDVNLMPIIIEAVREYASLGEICSVLRREFGEHKESVVL